MSEGRPDLAGMAKAMGRRADELALAALVAGVSVRRDAVLKRLAEANLACLGRDGRVPAAWELDQTCNTVIGWSRANASLVGGVTGLAGVLGVAPEIAAHIASMLRLAQRLAIVYGFDPANDRGQLVVTQALAAGLGVELPPGGLTTMRVTELLWRLVQEMPDAQLTTGQVITSLVVRGALLAAGRIGRMVPLIASGIAVVEDQQRIADAGLRMRAVLQRLAELPRLAGPVEDAIEVEPA